MATVRDITMVCRPIVKTFCSKVYKSTQQNVPERWAHVSNQINQLYPILQTRQFHKFPTQDPILKNRDDLPIITQPAVSLVEKLRKGLREAPKKKKSKQKSNPK